MIAIAALIWIASIATAIYFFILNRRLTRELVRHTWRAPTVLLSGARGAPRRVWTLYGVDWRITSPVTLASLPRFVPDAFVAAEDVRFHHHIGIDPIGMPGRSGSTCARTASPRAAARSTSRL